MEAKKEITKATAGGRRSEVSTPETGK